MRAYIGYDPREERAVEVASRTLKKVSGITAELLRSERLADAGLLWRISDHRGGQAYDLVSNAPKSTAFAASRFLVPILCQDGWALFTDCDVVFMRDPREMVNEIEIGKAVYVVKHEYTPVSQWKMDSQVQTVYPRKNWSSVMLFDCGHPANRRLSLHDVNTRPGRDLHALYWLNDAEIGELDPAWNWLVGEQPMPDRLGIAHVTNGGPFTQGWKGGPHDDIWLREA